MPKKRSRRRARSAAFMNLFIGPDYSAAAAHASGTPAHPPCDIRADP